MTTNHNTPTRSATNAHEGQTVADTNQPKAYRANFILTQRSSGSAIVSAISPEEALKMADKLDLSDIDNWEVYEDEMTLEFIDSEEGQSHE